MKNAINNYLTEMKEHRNDAPREILKLFSDCFHRPQHEADFFGVDRTTVEIAVSKKHSGLFRPFPMHIKKRRITPDKEIILAEFLNDMYPVRSGKTFRATTHTRGKIYRDYVDFCDRRHVVPIKRTCFFQKYFKAEHFHFEKTGFRCRWCIAADENPLHQIIRYAQWDSYHDLKERFASHDIETNDCLMIMDWCEIELQKASKFQMLVIIIYHDLQAFENLGPSIRVCYCNEVGSSEHNDIQVLLFYSLVNI